MACVAPVVGGMKAQLTSFSPRLVEGGGARARAVYEMFVEAQAAKGAPRSTLRTYAKSASTAYELKVLRREAELHRAMVRLEPDAFVPLHGASALEPGAAWSEPFQLATRHPGGDFVLLRDVEPCDRVRAVTDSAAALDGLFARYRFVHGDAHGRNVMWSSALPRGRNVVFLDLGMSALMNNPRFDDNYWSPREAYYINYRNHDCTYAQYWHGYDVVMCALLPSSDSFDTLAAVWGVPARLIADTKAAYTALLRRKRRRDSGNFTSNFWAAYVGADRLTGRLTEAHLAELRAELESTAPVARVAAKAVRGAGKAAARDLDVEHGKSSVPANKRRKLPVACSRAR